MGNPEQKLMAEEEKGVRGELEKLRIGEPTAEKEEPLRGGVPKPQIGKWKLTHGGDPVFNRLLFARSDIDLKDKWRNLGVGSVNRAATSSIIIAHTSVSVDSSSSQDASMDN